jgi:FSR family fosmidomycin resistance protein-like MFS transporter
MKTHRTRSLFLIALGHLSIELCSQFLPVLYPVLIATLGLGYAQVGVIALVAGVGTSLAQPLFGYLSDLWGPHWFSALGIAWVGLIMGLVGWAGSYALTVLVVGLGVLGSAAFHPAGASIVSTAAGSRRGTATSVFSVGGSVGTALSPLWMAFGLERWGLRGTLVLAPVALLVSAVLYHVVGRGARSLREESQRPRSASPRERFPGMALIIVSVMFLAWFQHTFRSYLPIWIEGQADTLLGAGKMLSVYLAAAGVGSLSGGVLSDRIGRWQLLALCLGLLGPAQLLFLSASGPLQVLLIATIGLLTGATFPAGIVMAQEALPNAVGIASGLVMGLGWLPGGLGASLTGLIADRYSLATGLRLLALPAALGTLSILAYAVVRGRQGAQG